MCVINTYHIVAIWWIVHPTFSQRRIENGSEVDKDMPFAVYLLKAAPSERMYKGWTCGGSIVSPDLIITSAACVEDVKHLYAIAGYKKFVEAEDIDIDKCTKTMKKKVIFTCVPKAYDLEFTKIEKWAITDIAVVKVESPYDFEDTSYQKICSYIPTTIRVNYERKYQEPGVEAMALGWGHTAKWRSTNDEKSYNSETLRYVSTSILNKTACKKHYKTKNETQENKELLQIIDKYMICTLHPGNINDRGEIVSPSKPDLEGCITKDDKMTGAIGSTCEERNESKESKSSGETKTSNTRTIIPNETDIESNDEIYDAGEPIQIEINENDNSMEIRRSFTRRNGICQNDHGGPLVTWVGTHEVLIGVASVFRIVNGTKCAGPYLFTSTQCNGKFLDCILHGVLTGTENATRRSCDGPPAERGFYMIERRISWIGHPDGPAENEMLEMRPQVPLSQYNHG